MTTIHYAMTTPTSRHQPDGEEGRRRCAQTIEEAINAAMRVCSYVRETTTADFIATADRYLVDIHLIGECQGCEPISFGWTRDFESPYEWVMRGFCKTSTARDPLKAHLLVAHVIEEWRRQGLVDWTEDEAGYLPHMQLENLVGTSNAPSQVQTWVMRLRRALS